MNKVFLYKAESKKKLENCTRITQWEIFFHVHVYDVQKNRLSAYKGLTDEIDRYAKYYPVPGDDIGQLKATGGWALSVERIV